MGLMWPKRGGKYGARRTKIGDQSFASKLEAQTYQLLNLLEKAKEIEIVQVQASVHLTDARILYKPDFLIKDLKTNQLIWVEAKGFQTPEWKIKKRLWVFYGPGPLHIYTQTRAGPTLSEVVLLKSKTIFNWENETT